MERSQYPRGRRPQTFIDPTVKETQQQTHVLIAGLWATKGMGETRLNRFCRLVASLSKLTVSEKNPHGFVTSLWRGMLKIPQLEVAIRV